MTIKRWIYSFVTIILVVVLGICCFGKSFSKYISNNNANINTSVAKWNVSLKNEDTELEKSFNLTFPLSSDNNENVGNNKFAPGSSVKASFILDLTNTEVSIDYNITVGSLKNQIGLSDITLEVLDNNNQPVILGKDICVPLENRQKFTSENGGIVKIYFNLTWSADSNSLSDTNLTLTRDVLSLPVSVKIKQHVEDSNFEEEQKKITSNISYIETTETKPRKTQPINYTFDNQDVLSENPERGFYSTSNIGLDENGLVLPSGYSSAITKSNTSNMLYLKVNLSEFSGNMNAAGKDKELTSAAITAFDEILRQIKQNNNTVILRFVYDNNATGIIEGKAKVEPGQEMLLKHIDQLSSTFKKYSTTINVIQIGFYGLWGECYYNTDAQSNPGYYKQTVTALLNATEGTEITIAVRTPEYYSWYREIDINNIDSDITTSSESAYRVCVFNDGYAASVDDLGTYKDREKEVAWLNNQASHTFFGGEALPDATTGENGEILYEDGVGPYNTSEYFINEAYKVHTSYINWEWNQAIHEQWSYQIYNGSNFLYNGKSALTYIENHLGYRFVMREVRTYEYAESYGILPIDISIGNVGFGNLIKNKQADIVIADSAGNVVKSYLNVDIDAKDFLSQTTIKKSIVVNLPELSNGDYQIYLRLSSGEILDNGLYYSSIRFANDDVYNSELQANYIGKFTVK